MHSSLKYMYFSSLSSGYRIHFCMSFSFYSCFLQSENLMRSYLSCMKIHGNRKTQIICNSPLPSNPTFSLSINHGDCILEIYSSSGHLHDYYTVGSHHLSHLDSCHSLIGLSPSFVPLQCGDRAISLKYKSSHVTPLFKILQWPPISEEKSKFL